jgi:hypothetical protein
MNKVEEIFKSWNISFNPNDKQSELASKRIEICNSCEHKVTNLGVNRCSVCGCALKGKVFSPVKGACPKGKWDSVDMDLGLPTKEKKLRFLCAQPASIYYLWQVEVMINNFRQKGINLNDVDIVCSIDNEIPEDWKKLANNYPARFFFYKDERKNKKYISSIRPNILKQHFKLHPYLKNDVIFYHDCDIMFTKNPKEWITQEMINDDKWYGSDVIWYISHDYIKSKGDDVLEMMCDISGIPSKTIKDNQNNSIGAQYLLKDISHNFWERIEYESEMLFSEITSLNLEKKKKDPKYHELQIWCADMWVLLWNGWKMGKETVVHKNFNFSWGTSSKKDFYECNIFHNAGVTTSESKLFYKALYTTKLPYNDDLKIDENKASYQYFNFIKKVGKKSVLLLH